MPIRHPRTLLLCLALVLLAGCGGSSEQPAEGPAPTVTSPPSAGTTAGATTSTTTTTTTPTRTTPRSREAAYEEAFSDLPLGSPPLNVVQTIRTAGKPEQLDARVRRNSFLCSRTPEQRLAAVRAYYDEVIARLRRNGEERLTLRVSRLTPTSEIKDVYATADSSGDVELSERGAGPAPDGC